MRTHAELARKLDGYRLSLHSGSDKFSIYKLFAEAAQGNFHIKTSGASWLQAIKWSPAKTHPYSASFTPYAPERLWKTRKHTTSISHPSISHLSRRADLLGFYAAPDVAQLFHISYGTLLEARRDEIRDVLRSGEARHYEFVSGHIDRHLRLLF